MILSICDKTNFKFLFSTLYHIVWKFNFALRLEITKDTLKSKVWLGLNLKTEDESNYGTCSQILGFIGESCVKVRIVLNSSILGIIRSMLQWLPLNHLALLFKKCLVMDSDWALEQSFNFQRKKNDPEVVQRSAPQGVK